MHFYLIQSQVEPRLCQREFSNFEWADPEDVLARLQPGLEKWKDDLPILFLVLLAEPPSR
jgi:hypothetical protein